MHLVERCQKSVGFNDFWILMKGFSSLHLFLPGTFCWGSGPLGGASESDALFISSLKTQSKAGKTPIEPSVRSFPSRPSPCVPCLVPLSVSRLLPGSRPSWDLHTSNSSSPPASSLLKQEGVCSTLRDRSFRCLFVRPSLLQQRVF